MGALSFLIVVLAAVVLTGCGETGVVDVAAYYPGAQAQTHVLAAANGGRTVFHFPSSWDAVRGGTFGRETDGCVDWHTWFPDALQYLGLDCPARRLNVTILPLTHRALPRRTTLPWAQEVRAWEATITDGVASLGQPDTLRVSLERGALDGEAAIVLRFARRDGSGETWWLVDCIIIEPDGGCAPGMRRLAAFDRTGATWFDRRYARWARR